MSPAQQRITIAEACGWKRITEPRWVEYFWRPGAMTGANAYWLNEKGKPMLEAWMPDYLNDLNAMHEAEEVLNGRVDGAFADYGEHLRATTDWPQWHTTAAQRAEAFLRTIGKWEALER